MPIHHPEVRQGAAELETRATPDLDRTPRAAARPVSANASPKVDVTALARAFATSSHAAGCACCGANAAVQFAEATPEAHAEPQSRSSIHGAKCSCGACGGAGAATELRDAQADAARADTARADAAEAGLAQEADAQLDEDGRAGGCPGPTLNEASIEQAIKDKVQKAKDTEQPAGGEPAPEGSEAAQPAAAPASGSAKVARAKAHGTARRTIAKAVGQHVRQARSAHQQARAGWYQGMAEMIAGAGTVSAAYPDTADWPSTLGLTRWNYDQFTYPALNFTPITPSMPDGVAGPPQAFAVELQATSAADSTWYCVAAPTGEKKWKDIIVPVEGVDEAEDVVMELFVDVTADYHTKIVAAEQEHLDDLTRAFNISIKAAADVVNGLVGTQFEGMTEAAAQQAAKDRVAEQLDAKMGADVAVWRQVLRDLCDLTISQRDDQRTHTFGLSDSPEEDDIDVDANKAVVRLDDGSTRQFPSTDIIQFSNV